MGDVPQTWAETLSLLAGALGGPHADPDAREWLREALEASYGVQDVMEVPRARRPLALQRFIGATLRVQDYPADLAFTIGVRGIVAAAFARHWGGLVLTGPPWRIDPSETLPSRDEWLAAADF